MPGSRVAEIKRMAPLYGAVLDLLKSDVQDLDAITQQRSKVKASAGGIEKAPKFSEKSLGRKYQR